MTEKIVKVYEENIGNLNIKCTVDSIEYPNPAIIVESSSLIPSVLAPKIEISYYKEQVRDLVLFLQRVIEAHDAATKNQ